MEPGQLTANMETIMRIIGSERECSSVIIIVIVVVGNAALLAQLFSLSYPRQFEYYSRIRQIYGEMTASGSEYYFECLHYLLE